MILEICAANYQSATNAQKAGAHRIELCSELAVGGITPSFGLLKKVIDSVFIPVFVLIRPRSGSFTYSDAEFDIMKENIILCKSQGVAGIVSGVLKEDYSIDVERTQELIELSKPLPFTFHRAFDWTPNPIEALGQLINIGTKRILTSGQESKTEEGLELLQQLNSLANNRIIILPGSGINSDNALLFKESGFKEIHASASTILKNKKLNTVSMNSSIFLSDVNSYYSDTNKIKAILKTISNEN